MPFHLGGLAVNELIERWKKRAVKINKDADCFESEGDLVNAALLRVRASTMVGMIVELKKFTDKQNEQS